jgi:ABC-type multidrug transport system fused ATPase/permease subunit
MNIFKKFWGTLNSKYKFHFFWLILLITINSLIEMISLTAIIPFATILLKINTGNFFFGLINLDSILLKISYEKLIIVSSCGIILIFLFKSLFSIFVNFCTYKYAYSLKNNVSSRVLEKYLHQDYNFHIHSNSSRLLSSLTSDINAYNYSFVIPVITFLSESLIILISILLILFFGYYKIIYFFSIFFLIGIFFLKKFNSKTKLWSKHRQEYDIIQIKNINSAISGIKEIILLNAFKKYFSKFRLNNYKISKIEIKQSLVVYFPKAILEFLGIIFLTLIIFFAFFFKQTTSEIFIILTFYIVIAYRLTPSFNKVVNSYQSIKYADQAVNTVSNELKLKNKIIYNDFFLEKRVFNNSFEFKKVFFKYPNSAEYILEDINFKLTKNETIGIFGKSGAGKTTFVDLITCVLYPTNGSIFIDDKVISNSLDIRNFQNTLCYISQNYYILDDTIEQNIVFGIEKNKIDYKLLDKVLHEAQLYDFVFNLPLKLETEIGDRGIQLSGGQKQRICIARSLYLNRDIIILDEATNALDYETEQKIINLIYSFKKTKTIIIISHKKELLNLCDKIYLVENKKLKLSII